MNAHALSATRAEDRNRHREATFTNLAVELRQATTHAERRRLIAAAAVTLAAVEPLHNRPTAYCAVTVRRPEAGGTGVTVTVAEVGGAA